MNVCRIFDNYARHRYSVDIHLTLKMFDIVVIYLTNIQRDIWLTPEFSDIVVRYLTAIRQTFNRHSSDIQQIFRGYSVDIGSV